MSGGASPTSQTMQTSSTQSKSEPHPYIQGDLLGLLGGMRSWFEKNPTAPGYFPNGTVAPQDPRTISANTTAWQRGAGGMGHGVDPALKTMMADTLGGKYLDAGQNPHFQRNLDNINRRQNEVWADTVKPAIDATFAGAGRTSSGLHGANVVRSATDLGRAQAEAGINAMSGLYDAERNRMNQVAGLAPAINSMDWQNIAGMTNAANADYAHAQRLLDDKNARYQYEATAQPDFLTNMAQRFLGMFPGGQTLGSGTSMAHSTSNPGGGGFGSIAGPIMSGVGMALPFFAPMFSDERLKEDITPVGKLNDGQSVYSYRYKGDPRTQIGLLAHEVAAFHPEAVARHPSGYLMVDYRKATPPGGLF